MNLFISVESPEEAILVARTGRGVIDIKNPRAGALGAAFPWDIESVVLALGDERPRISGALGDLAADPGTAALAARAAAGCGCDLVKAGLFGTRSLESAIDLLAAVRRGARDVDPAVVVVAAGYADAGAWGGLAPELVVAAARAAACDVAMLDTYTKDGRSILELAGAGALRRFVESAHAAGLHAALAGGLRREDLDTIAAIGADWAGVRGAVCEGGDRRRPLCPLRLDSLLATAAAAIAPPSLDRAGR